MPLIYYTGTKTEKSMKQEVRGYTTGSMLYYYSATSSALFYL